MGQRPTGITILAVLFAVGGVLGILAGVALLGIGAIAGAGGVAGLGGLAAIFGVVALVLGALEIAEAYGLWTLKSWAWTLGVGLAAVSLGYIVVQAVLSGNIVASLTSVNTIVSIVIWAIVLWYLFQPSIKAALGRS